MGFFSWKTSDTNESIANKFTDQCRPVYMLQPNGKPPIYEPEYEGYGVFGGVDAMLWLTEVNVPSYIKEKFNDEEKRKLGVLLSVNESSGIWKDNKDRLWTDRFNYFLTNIYDSINIFSDYESIAPEYGKTINDLIEDGEFVSVSLASFIDTKFPLKFSFSDNAVYESLPAAQLCPYQGFCFPVCDFAEDEERPGMG